MAGPKMAGASTTSSMTSTSHTMTAWPTSTTNPNSSNPSAITDSSPMANLLAALAPANRHSFIAPPASLPNTSLEFAKSTLDSFAGALGDEQTQRLKESRKKRKRGEVGEEVGEVLKIRKVHTEGYAVEQVWEQARRVIDSLMGDAERGLRELGGVETESQDEDEGHDGEVDGGVELSEVDEDELDVALDDESVEELEEYEEEDYENEGEEGDDLDGDLSAENVEMEDEFEGEDDYDEAGSEDDETAGVFVEDPNKLNDGFFSIDEFNQQTEFLEQQDATADPNTGEASDEEDIDWEADPLGIPANTMSSSRRAAAMDIDEDEDEDEGTEDEDGPTFGNMDINQPEGASDEEDDDADVDESMNQTGDNTNDISYKDFFEPPPRKAGKGERQAKYLERKSRKATTEEDDGANIERAIANVRRDLFDDLSDEANSESALSDVDRGDPKSRRSAHERRQAKLAEEIRRLEAASVAKRQWTLSGEARAADRPQNSLLSEELDFERTGKPVPVITAEVSESIEDLIKRRILAQEFDEVVRRRPDSLTPANTRRGAFELDDTKPQKGLAEMYEEEHVKNTNPDSYVSQADEKLQKEEKEVEALWKNVSAKLDALTSWHYKPKPAAPSLTVVSDVATISMEDAQPTTASGINGGESMLAPQEIYKSGQDKDTVAPGEVIPKSGAPVAREEMTREEKLRRRRREKERIKKRGGDEANQPPKSQKAQKKQDTIKELKKGGVMVIGRKGEIRDVEGNKAQAAALVKGAGGFKL